MALAFEIVAPRGYARQHILDVLHDDFTQLGAAVMVNQIDPQFFSFDLGADQRFCHMPWDSGLWADGTFTVWPVDSMRRWYSGKHGNNIAQKSKALLGERETYQGMFADTQ